LVVCFLIHYTDIAVSSVRLFTWEGAIELSKTG
jgi:hypothetical protein